MSEFETILRGKLEQIAEKYANLIDKELSATLEQDSPVDVHEALDKINEGIKMMGYLTISMNKIGGPSRENGTDHQ